ncbi:hypothetical protein E2L08_05790 [Palleronia sediminis]|uniref:Uncharacterized protein n=1 Tax=Palleronia sediminis TaxID=2547833 RepID=A0A4R6AJL8_9RHOB|nr:hypothetical protein [Palleronia sediminis]TDL81623.1 hypothetical protein E2L08_05790 [Palleronia sediminis]
MTRIAAALLAACLALPAAAVADQRGDTVARPNPQLALSVARRAAFYGVAIAPEALTLAQAAALHMAMVAGGRSRVETRRRIEQILRSDAFRD